MVDKFDKLMEEAAKLAMEQTSKEIPTPKETHVFSAEHEAKMQKIFKQARRREMLRNMRKYAAHAAVILILLTTATTFMMYNRAETPIIGPALEPFGTMPYLENPSGTTEFPPDSNPNRPPFRSAEGEPPSIENIQLGFIPEGFTLEQSEAVEGRQAAVFTAEELHFTISIEEAVEITPAIIREAQRLEINEIEAFHIIEDDIHIIILSDEESPYTITITGNLPEEEIILIAENLQQNPE